MSILKAGGHNKQFYKSRKKGISTNTITPFNQIKSYKSYVPLVIPVWHFDKDNPSKHSWHALRGYHNLDSQQTTISNNKKLKPTKNDQGEESESFSAQEIWSDSALSFIVVMKLPDIVKSLMSKAQK